MLVNVDDFLPSLAVIALKLKEVFGLNDVNELPIVYNIALVIATKSCNRFTCSTLFRSKKYSL